MTKTTKVSAGLFFLVTAIGMPFVYQNCGSPVKFQESPNESETPPTCTGELLGDLYESSITHHTVTQDAIAQVCVDSSINYAQNIGFTSADTFMNVRFQSSCAGRWCRTHFNDTGAVGLVTSNLAFNGGGTLNVGASIQLDCRHNDETLLNTAGFCSVELNQKKPLVEYAVLFTDPKCSFCGCNQATVSQHWSVSIAELVDCGTRYCKDADPEFKWGILAEVGTNISWIRCSRAENK